LNKRVGIFDLDLSLKANWHNRRTPSKVKTTVVIIKKFNSSDEVRDKNDPRSTMYVALLLSVN